MMRDVLSGPKLSLLRLGYKLLNCFLVGAQPFYEQCLAVILDTSSFFLAR